MLFRNKVLLAKIETTYGTDPTPTGAANAMLTKNLQIQPYNGNRVTRDLDRSTLGAQSEINTGAMVQVTFDVEIAGAGAAGTAPKYGPLLRACGLSETVNAGVSVVYAPISATFESVTMYWFVDGQQHKVTGARGSFSCSLQRGQIPVMSFTFTGLYNRPTAVANPTPTLTGFQVPLAVTKVNTPTFTLHAYAAYCEAFNFDMQNNVVYRNLIGSESVIITDRNVRGNTVIEAPVVGTKDYFSAAEAHAGITLAAVQLIHGTTAGNIFQIDGPKVQLASIGMQDSDGILTYSMDTIFTPNAANDEVVLTVK